MSGLDPRKVDEARRYCRDVTRRRARNFYYGLKLTPEPQRSALYCVYAWMRRADDLVDDADERAGDPRDKIDAFRTATEAALAGTTSNDDPVWIGLADTATRYDLPRDAFRTMLEGQLEDLAHRQYQTNEEVLEYCRQVASTVGVICISIWGYDDPAAPGLAVDRGIAFQLTNMLRDYKEDYDADRVYLPKEDFDRLGLSARALRQWSEPARCRGFVLEQVARAKSFYLRSAPLDRMITRSCRPTLWAMTAIYLGLLGKIERFPRKIISGHRLRLSSLRKGTIALQARWRAGRQQPAGHAAVSKA